MARGASLALVVCLATAAWTAGGATGQGQTGWVESLGYETSGKGLLVSIVTSVPVPHFTCMLPLSASREIVIRFPEAENRVQDGADPANPLISTPIVESGSAARPGVTIRIGLSEGTLASLEQGPRGLLLRFTRTAAGAAPGVAGPQEYRVGVGDKLEIAVFGHDDLTKVVEVRGDGNISYPLIGELPVAGKTVAEVNDAITKILGKDYLVDPQVSVDIREYQSQWVTILGEVRTPGRYVLRRNMHLIDLLAEAGGATKEAGDEIVITRHPPGSSDTRQINVSQQGLLGGENQDANLALQHGDIITVQEQKIFYIRGEVAKPGSYYLAPGMTILRAISVAGGFSAFANRKAIDLLRTDASGVSHKTTINLKAIEDGKKEDLPLSPNDIVIVPRRIF